MLLRVTGRVLIRIIFGVFRAALSLHCIKMAELDMDAILKTARGIVRDAAKRDKLGYDLVLPFSSSICNANR